VLFGRHIRKRIRVTPVLRRAVTSTAQQQGWRTRPTDGVDQACLTSPGCLFVRSEAPRFIPGDSHKRKSDSDRAAFRCSSALRDAWASRQGSGDNVAAADSSISALRRRVAGAGVNRAAIRRQR